MTPRTIQTGTISACHLFHHSRIPQTFDPIHVDAAIGGFILPFTLPELRWDFRLPQVRSINVSAHKFGLVYPGLGWLIFRDAADLPEDLVFHVNYFGDAMPSYTLSFPRGSGVLLAQYYNRLRLGWKGYARAAEAVLENARYSTERLFETQHFDILNAGKVLPVIIFKSETPSVSLRSICPPSSGNEVGVSPPTRCH